MKDFVESPLFLWVIASAVVLGYLLKMGSKGVRTDTYPNMELDLLTEHTDTRATPFISMGRDVVPNPVYPRGPMMISKER